MKVATLIDVDRKDGDWAGNLNQRALLKKSNVLSLTDFTGKLESDIEDMFDEAFFLDLVNAEFKANLQKVISPSDLDGHIPRINARLEAYFQANPMRNGVSYSHYRPARYFSERVTALESRISKDTFDRFQAAFDALNALLQH
jgi:hypothetical protein